MTVSLGEQGTAELAPPPACVQLAGRVGTAPSLSASQHAGQVASVSPLMCVPAPLATLGQGVSKPSATLSAKMVEPVFPHFSAPALVEPQEITASNWSARPPAPMVEYV